jgi:virginiamycin B lyase
MLPPLFQSASLRTIRSRASRNRRASAARSAAGRPARKTNGSASVDIRGTRSTPEASAQLAFTSGLKRNPSRVAAGRSTRSGMRTESVNTMKLVTSPKQRMSRMWVLLAAIAMFVPQVSQAASGKPGVREVQVPFGSLKPAATIKVGRTADWVLVTENAVWIATTKPYAVQRIDPAINKIIATVALSGEACSGQTYAFGSIWVPLCGKNPALVRINIDTNAISATLPVGPVDAEESITASDDSVWIVTERNSTLDRIDPSNNSVRQKIPIPPGSYNPFFSNGVVWITGVENNVLTAVDASTGKVMESFHVGSKPRFLFSGGGSVWVLNQGDGSISRVDEKTRKVVARVQVGIPGTGGDLVYAEDHLWIASFGVPLSLIEPTTNKVSRQWVGRGGDSLRYGHDSIWLTDYYRGLLWRFRIQDLTKK